MNILNEFVNQMKSLSNEDFNIDLSKNMNEVLIETAKILQSELNQVWGYSNEQVVGQNNVSVEIAPN